MTRVLLTGSRHQTILTKPAKASSLLVFISLDLLYFKDFKNQNTMDNGLQIQNVRKLLSYYIYFAETDCFHSKSQTKHT
jgi:hypothetical protein